MTDFQQHVGPFQLHSQTGRTPITNRYHATDRRSGQPVTLHLLTPEAAQQTSLVEQFLSNGSQAIRLRHPGLVAVVDAGEAQGTVYIATQWVEGQSLAERLRRANSIVNIEAAAYILNALAAVLDYTHQQGFIHGHITLDQICITNNNEVLLDGFAQAVHVDRVTVTAAPQETATNPVVFISPFMAPEQAKAGEAVEFRADIYSLGAILYAMLLGRPPFAGETTQQLLQAIVEEPPLPPESINPALPPAMIYVLKLVLAKDPAARYASAGEFANAFLQSTQWRAAPPVTERAVTYQRRGLATLILLPLLAILCFVLLTGASLGWFGQRFAFLSATTGGGLTAQLRGLLGSDPVVAQLTAQPAMLTPVVMVTITPSPPTLVNLPKTPTVAVALAVNETQGVTTTTTTLDPLTNTLVITATTAGVTPTKQLTPTASTNGGTTSTTTATVASTLIIDPVGLLTGPIAAGKVIINGIAEPGMPVQVQINGETIGSTETKVSGTWSMIVDLSQPGAYDITAEMLDQNGNVVAAAQQQVTVAAEEDTADNTAPPSPTATEVAQPTATYTNTVPPTATNTPAPTATREPTTIATNTPLPTATNTYTPRPTATATNTPLPTATHTHTPQPTATVTNTQLLMATHTHTPKQTATVTNTPLPTATHTATMAPTVTATATNTPRPPATATNTVLPTLTPILQPTDTATVEATATPVPTATNTSTVVPTATYTNTALPTATATNTPRPTATKTATPVPTATYTNTALPTATNTPRPTATKTATPVPTATYTNTAAPAPTATNTPRPTVTNTPRPTATNTPRPTVTNTPRPTATNTPRPTVTNTPRPAATNTLRPTVTNTPRPTVTNTLQPTATNTPVPTATNTPLPTATYTPVLPTNTPRPTNTPAPTATNTLVPTPTAVSGSIAPVAPGDGNSGQGQQTFSWTANFTPSEGYAFELVFWKAGEDPLRQSFGLAAPTTNLNVTLDLPRLDEQLGGTFDTGEYNWGVLLVRTTPAYERVQYLGGGYRFTYYRGGGDSGSGGQSSGE